MITLYIGPTMPVPTHLLSRLQYLIPLMVLTLSGCTNTDAFCLSHLTPINPPPQARIAHP